MDAAVARFFFIVFLVSAQIFPKLISCSLTPVILQMQAALANMTEKIYRIEPEYMTWAFLAKPPYRVYL